MAIFPWHSTINSGTELKQAFAQMGCDNRDLPLAYYDALLSVIEEHASAIGEEHYMLDVIYWHCATTYTKLDDKHITSVMSTDDEENPTAQELANYLQEYTTVIWQDGNTVYHLTY